MHTSVDIHNTELEASRKKKEEDFKKLKEAVFEKAARKGVENIEALFKAALKEAADIEFQELILPSERGWGECGWLRKYGEFFDEGMPRCCSGNNSTFTPQYTGNSDHGTSTSSATLVKGGERFSKF